MNISMGWLETQGQDLDREVEATLSNMACHMTLVSLCMGQEEDKDPGEISTFGRRKERETEKEQERFGGVGEREKPGQYRIIGQPTATGDVDNEPRTC